MERGAERDQELNANRLAKASFEARYGRKQHGLSSFERADGRAARINRRLPQAGVCASG